LTWLASHRRRSREKKLVSACSPGYLVDARISEDLDPLRVGDTPIERRRISTQALAHHEPPPLRGCLILVVEDDVEAAAGLRRLLEQLGARVVVASDGLQGLARLADAPPDAVLCDLTMPVMDGLEFARRVRRNPRFQRLLLVAVTGRQAHQDFLQTCDAGFDAHLVKPVTAEMLQSLARRVVGRCAGRERGA
jgi:CheY-like chemotaxis protein